VRIGKQHRVREYKMKGAGNSGPWFLRFPENLHFFHQRPLRAADGFDFLHPLLDGRFGEIRALFHLFQDSRTFVFLLEAAYGAVDVFILLNDDADHAFHLLPSVDYSFTM